MDEVMISIEALLDVERKKEAQMHTQDLEGDGKLTTTNVRIG
jgi:hypothetical protein